MINMDAVEVDLLRALNGHWKVNSDEDLFFEGQQRTTNVLQRYIEVKYFGPFLEDDDDAIGETTILIQVHLDCNVIGNDIYEINRLTGKMTAIARLPILVPEFGKCLKLLGIRVLPKGQVALKANQKVSIVEADYSIQLDTKGV
jgi:hypothetical protein